MEDCESVSRVKGFQDTSAVHPAYGALVWFPARRRRPGRGLHLVCLVVNRFVQGGGKEVAGREAG